ncbi:MAG: hypothetical protein GX066_05745 [Clostridiaceae bacterium]|nr:hypothetical protein [Clostridiaceae bacterium]
MYVHILRSISSILLAAVAFIYSFSTAHAVQYESRKAVFIIVNDFNLEDFLSVPSIYKIMEQGAIGLMNPRGAVRTDMVSAFATLGWGTRADALLRQCLIIKNKDSLQVVYVDELKDLNKNNTYNAKVGLLGDYLHSRGLRTAYIEATKNPLNAYSPGALVAMDSKGYIDDGATAADIQTQQSIPGVSYDEALYEVFMQKYATNDFIVLNMEEKHYIDGFIGRMEKDINRDNTLLIIVSPFYSYADSKEGKKLPPVILYGKGIEAGLLYSETTRREGIIGNIDIAPTIAAFFGGNLEEATGEVIKVQKRSNPIEKLLSLYWLTSFNSKNRAVVLKTYIGVQIVLLLIILAFILLRNARKARWSNFSRILKFLVLIVLACPIALFILPLFKIYKLPLLALLLVLIDVVIACLVCKLFHNREVHVIAISTITLVLIFLDILLGGPLNKTSLLGYDAVIGARYYGIGNEYMGIFVASALMTIVPLVYQEKLPRWGAIILFMLIIPVIGLSQFGANVGGTITASVAFGFAVLCFYGRRIRLKEILILFLITVSFIGVFAIYDIVVAEQKSHLARALADFHSKGISAIFNIVRRKLEMNIKLLRWTIWSRVLLVSVGVMTVLSFKPQGLLRMLFNKYKSFSLAWYSILIAGITGMLVNDSGVVVAATSNIFLIFSLLYFLLGEEKVGIQGIG